MNNVYQIADFKTLCGKSRRGSKIVTILTAVAMVKDVASDCELCPAKKRCTIWTSAMKLKNYFINTIPDVDELCER